VSKASVLTILAAAAVPRLAVVALQVAVAAIFLMTAARGPV